MRLGACCSRPRQARRWPDGRPLGGYRRHRRTPARGPVRGPVPSREVCVGRYDAQIQATRQRPARLTRNSAGEWNCLCHQKEKGNARRRCTQRSQLLSGSGRARALAYVSGMSCQVMAYLMRSAAGLQCAAIPGLLSGIERSGWGGACTAAGRADGVVVCPIMDAVVKRWFDSHVSEPRLSVESWHIPSYDRYTKLLNAWGVTQRIPPDQA